MGSHRTFDAQPRGTEAQGLTTELKTEGRNESALLLNVNHGKSGGKTIEAIRSGKRTLTWSRNWG